MAALLITNDKRRGFLNEIIWNVLNNDSLLKGHGPFMENLFFIKIMLILQYLNYHRHMSVGLKNVVR